MLFQLNREIVVGMIKSRSSPRNYPDSQNRPVNLTQEERNIYSLIARQYLMQFCPDAEYRKSKITLNIAGGTFIAQARNLQTAGWKELLGKEDDTENQEPLLPIVKKGQILYCGTWRSH